MMVTVQKGEGATSEHSPSTTALSIMPGNVPSLASTVFEFLCPPFISHSLMVKNGNGARRQGCRTY